MTSTEKHAFVVLREMLDERGVEYETDDRNGLKETIWCDTAAFQLSPTAKMTMIVTPEQAVAATLGLGECEMAFGDDMLPECGNCGEPLNYYTKRHGMRDRDRRSAKFCPQCGKAVKL